MKGFELRRQEKYLSATFQFVLSCFYSKYNLDFLYSLVRFYFVNKKALKIEKEIKECDMLIVGTPVYWGNMNGKLKCLFDRLVAVMMGESKMGIPLPLHKGKKAIIVTSCTTPFPFNYICGQSSGAVRAVREVLKSSGFKVIRKINLSNTKKRK